MRLDKFIADSTVLSRKEVKKLVKDGVVFINDVQAKHADTHIKEESDRVTIDGDAIVYRKFVYLMLNKPQGYLSATEDKRDPVVIDIVPEEFMHYDLSPVGRLDKDTEGLLILTNDGQFIHAITSPKKNIYKRYFAVLDSPAQVEDIETFKAGMELEDFTARPAVLEITENPCEVYIKIAEGKFHQVKRMCERIGKNVTYLKRISIGGLELDPALAIGQVRELTPEDLENIRKGDSETSEFE